jgi:hypothetical protein
MRPDDCSVDVATLAEIKQHVNRALKDSGAVGVFPTPVSRIIAAANLSVDGAVSLDDGFFAKLYRAGAKVRRAVSKVLGVLDVKARLIYLDRTIHKTRQAFVSLHETGHECLPWQRDTYAFLEDCEQSLDLDLKEQFEREANVFASEVMFQGDLLRTEADRLPFEIQTAINLAKQFGASLYATLRRYVSTAPQPCVLIVYEAPAWVAGQGYGAALRRVIASTAFLEQFGEVQWPDRCTKHNFLSPLLFPKWKIKRSVKCNVLIDGAPVPFRFDAFHNGQYGYYVLAFPEVVRPPRHRRAVSSSLGA